MRLSNGRMAAPNYRATRNADGTFNIHGIEVFGELAKGQRGVSEDIGKAWMADAIKTARLLEGERFKYVCHVQHNAQPGIATTPSGYIRLTHVGPITYRGEPMDALFADIVAIPPDVFQDILDRKLPYRSVEINDVTGEPEVNTLALLSTQPPHFQFPVLDDSTIELDAGAVVPETVTAFAALKGEQAAHNGGAMKRKNLTLAVVDGALTGTTSSGTNFRLAEGEKPNQGEFVLHTPEGDFGVDWTPAMFADDDKKDDKEDPKDKQIADLKAQLADLKKKLKAADGPDEDDDAEDRNGDKMAADTAKSVKLQARVDALEANEAERLSAEKSDERGTDALADLKGAGWHVPARCEGTILKLAAAADTTLLDGYVEEFKATRTKDPRSAAVIEAAGATDHDEVSKYLDDGPDAHESAAKFSAIYDELAASSFGISMTREDFIKSRMKPLTVEG